ncbi:MAG: ribosome-binding factor A [Spirosomaceae bacterium]|nr:ribosome-binding factor A [Spirosomataceae bacterium]
METKRQKQYSKQIQKDLGDLFQRDFRKLFDGAFVTITDVKTTPDLGIARVYLSFMLSKDPEGLVEKIRENSSLIRGKFGNRVRHQFRVIPEFQFYLDDTAEVAQKMHELLDSLDIPEADPEEEEEN